MRRSRRPAASSSTPAPSPTAYLTNVLSTRVTPGTGTPADAVLSTGHRWGFGSTSTSTTGGLATTEATRTTTSVRCRRSSSDGTAALGGTAGNWNTSAEVVLPLATFPLTTSNQTSIGYGALLTLRVTCNRLLLWAGPVD